MNQARQDAAMLGIVLDAPEPEPFEVWPECVESLDLFLSMNTQWKVDGMSGTVMGLDYPALASVMDMTSVADRKQAFTDCRAMEAEALRVYRARVK